MSSRAPPAVVPKGAGVVDANAKDTFVIDVESLEGKPLPVSLTAGSTVWTMKQRIADLTGTPVEAQTLLITTADELHHDAAIHNDNYVLKKTDSALLIRSSVVTVDIKRQRLVWDNLHGEYEWLKDKYAPILTEKMYEVDGAYPVSATITVDGEDVGNIDAVLFDRKELFIEKMQLQQTAHAVCAETFEISREYFDAGNNSHCKEPELDKHMAEYHQYFGAWLHITRLDLPNCWFNNSTTDVPHMAIKKFLEDPAWKKEVEWQLVTYVPDSRYRHTSSTTADVTAAFAHTGFHKSDVPECRDRLGMMYLTRLQLMRQEGNMPV